MSSEEILPPCRGEGCGNAILSERVLRRQRPSGLRAGMPVTLVLILAWVGYAAYDYLGLRRRLARDLATAADGLVMSVKPFLEREDLVGVQAVVGSLAARPDVLHAYLCATDGRRLAGFVREGIEAAVPAMQAGGPPSFEGRRLRVFRDIVDRQGRRSGTLFVETSTEELARRMRSLAALGAATGLLALGLGLLRRRGAPSALPGDAPSEPAFSAGRPTPVGGIPARPPGGAGQVFRSESTSTVLVIDDDDETRELLARGLAREGFHVITAADWEQGIRRAREVRPDLIMLDAQMPEADGWSVLRTLREDAEIAHVPVVMTTLVNERAGGQLRTLHYLQKPVDPDRLTAALGSQPGAGEASILLVSEDGPLRQSLAAMLSPRGWMVLEAESPEAALQLLAGALPDVVLFDFDVRDGQGVAFVDSLRGHASWSEIPLLVLSSSEIPAEQRAAMEERPLRSLQKSALSSQELARQIRGLLDGGRQAPGARRADAS